MLVATPPGNVSPHVCRDLVTFKTLLRWRGCRGKGAGSQIGALAKESGLDKTFEAMAKKPYFSEEALKQLAQGYLDAKSKANNLVETVAGLKLSSPRGVEFAQHGLSRRITTLSHCIRRVFEILPPERRDLPSREDRHDAAIHIQAAIFNTFGCTDNLAWIWVSEKNVRNANGTQLSPMKIGLGPKYTLVRRSFPKEFQNYLESLDEWFGNLESYRHSLAHRIPLYIPPYTVDPKDEDSYQALERRSWALLSSGQVEEHKRAKDEQLLLKTFRPVIMHSFAEGAKPIVFHPQIIADFNTIEELSMKMIEYLK